MALLSRYYKTDTSLETDGIWFPICEDIEFKIKRAGGANKEFDKAVKSAMIRYKGVNFQQIGDEKTKEILYPIYAKTVVAGWKNILEIDDTGEEKELEFSVENCLKVFNDHPDLFLDVFNIASERQNYLERYIEVISKN